MNYKICNIILRLLKTYFKKYFYYYYFNLHCYPKKRFPSQYIKLPVFQRTHSSTVSILRRHGVRGTPPPQEGATPAPRAPRALRTRPQGHQGSLPNQCLKTTNARNGTIKDGRRTYDQSEGVKLTAATVTRFDQWGWTYAIGAISDSQMYWKD